MIKATVPAMFSCEQGSMSVLRTVQLEPLADMSFLARTYPAACWMDGRNRDRARFSRSVHVIVAP